MRFRARARLAAALATLAFLEAGAPAAQALKAGEDLLVTAEEGKPGGRVVASLRADPKTLNPATAVDLPSKELIALLSSDLVHINLRTRRTEPGLAKSWKASADGRHYTFELRRGLSFSDGHRFDADDVLFSFKVYLDEKVHSPQRDLLLVGGKPIQVRKLGPYRVAFDLATPYATGERLFDSVAILPRHRLEHAYDAGAISKAWSPATAPAEIAGLGPFRLKQYTPGERIVLERNPYYFKADTSGNRLPYLDEIAFLVVPTEDAEVIRFASGDLDVLERISAENYAALLPDQGVRSYRLEDLGAGFEYDFLFFNLNRLGANELPEIRRKQQWFRRDEFRQAVSLAVDRDAIVRLVYQGRATPLWGQVTPGNKPWVDQAVPHPAQSMEKASALLRSIGFRRKPDGTLVDAEGKPVEFSILVNPSNAQRTKIAALVADDLGKIGMRVRVVSLEFQALMTRVLNSLDYEASILGLVGGDGPNPEINVWTSNGGTHLWAQREIRPLPPWQGEIDRLMQRQTAILNFRKRKQAYDRVQELIAAHDPVVCLVSPNVLVGAKASLGGTQPSVMRNYLLWNAEHLFWEPTRATRAPGKPEKPLGHGGA